MLHRIVAVVFAPNYTLIARELLYLNASLIVFNIIPLPGLDGFYLLQSITRLSTETVLSLERWGRLILLLLIQIRPVRALLTVPAMWIAHIFIGLSNWLFGMFF